MSGLINQASAPEAPVEPDQQVPPTMMRFKDSALAQVDQQIRAKIPQSHMPQLMAIEHSGMQIMFSQKTHHLMQKYIDPHNIIETVSHAIPMLLALIYRQSNKKMDITMAGPAGVILALHALDYEEQIGALKLTPDVIANCVHAVAISSLQAFGIGPAQIQSVTQQGQQAQQAKQGQPTQPQGAM